MCMHIRNRLIYHRPKAILVIWIKTLAALGVISYSSLKIINNYKVFWH